MKGLGEMDEDETEKTLCDPKERIIKQISISDAQAANVLFEQLMGTGVQCRKQFIKEHSHEGGTYNAE